jgi:hypothetical protein
MENAASVLVLVVHPDEDGSSLAWSITELRQNDRGGIRSHNARTA